jgi:hypothetical protein
MPSGGGGGDTVGRRTLRTSAGERLGRNSGKSENTHSPLAFRVGGFMPSLSTDATGAGAAGYLHRYAVDC